MKRAVTIITSCIGFPIRSAKMASTRCLHYNVLYISPRQERTETESQKSDSVFHITFVVVVFFPTFVLVLSINTESYLCLSAAKVLKMFKKKRKKKKKKSRLSRWVSIHRHTHKGWGVWRYILLPRYKKSIIRDFAISYISQYVNI